VLRNINFSFSKPILYKELCDEDFYDLKGISKKKTVDFKIMVKVTIAPYVNDIFNGKKLLFDKFILDDWL